MPGYCQKSLLITAFAIAFATDAGAVEIKVSPYMQAVTNKSAVIQWQTYKNGDGTVHYGTSASKLNKTCKSIAPKSGDGYKNVYMERAFLKDLKPDTVYHYQVEVSGKKTKLARFRTHPTDPAEYYFLLYGDSRGDDGGMRHGKTIDAIIKHEDPLRDDLAKPPLFVIVTGDQTQQGRINPKHKYGNQYLKEFFGPGMPLMQSIDYIHCNGNHDGYKRAWAVTTPYNWNADGYEKFKTYQSFDRGPVHYVIIDSEQMGRKGWAEQVAWLKKDLAATSKPFIIAFFHISPYPASGKRYQRAADMRQDMVPIFEKYGVSMVLSGHDHYYGHATRKGVHYVISAGGGADLYAIDTKVIKEAKPVKFERVHHYSRFDIKPDSLTLTARRFDGSVIEKITVKSNKAYRSAAAPRAASAQPTSVPHAVPVSLAAQTPSLTPQQLRDLANAERIYAQAEVAELDHEFSRAMKLYDSITRRYAKTPGAAKARKRIDSIKKDPAKLASISRQNMRRKIKRLLARARSWESNGMPDRATKDYREILALAPESAEAAEAKGRILALTP